MQRILIVEDSETMRAMLTSTLEELSMPVKISEASSGFEALRCRGPGPLGGSPPRGRFRAGIAAGEVAASIVQTDAIARRELERTAVPKDGIEVARILLGHRSAGITEVYAEVDREKAMSVVSKIG